MAKEEDSVGTKGGRKKTTGAGEEVQPPLLTVPGRDTPETRLDNLRSRDAC